MRTLFALIPIVQWEYFETTRNIANWLCDRSRLLRAVMISIRTILGCNRPSLCALISLAAWISSSLILRSFFAHLIGSLITIRSLGGLKSNGTKTNAKVVILAIDLTARAQNH